ncbi:GGDEF domain-containing protein [Cyanobacteria bacterium FACHB-63]|nr:GGDEF domain-containing protein [Cyanobacteria bacterium FACHB-63]
MRILLIEDDAKPIVGAELLTRITNRLERSRLLQNLSTKDPLTGLANQLHSSRKLQQIISASPSSFSLAVLILTELHQLNFQYAHSTIHQILQQWGRLLQTALGSSRILGYWGNGEFLLGLPEQSHIQAEQCLANMTTTLRQQIFTTPEGKRFQASFSLGLATYPEDALTLHALYQAARSKAVLFNS